MDLERNKEEGLRDKDRGRFKSWGMRPEPTYSTSRRLRRDRRYRDEEREREGDAETETETGDRDRDRDPSRGYGCFHRLRSNGFGIDMVVYVE